MKKISILLIGIVIISCNETKKESVKSNEEQNVTEQVEVKQDSISFDWLLGKWKRLNEEEGKDTFENWTKNSETEYAGLGFTMQNNDTIKQEKIELKKSNGKWNLLVKTPEETESVAFEMTQHSETEFICVNNSIDFPNKIKYWKSGNKLKASVANSEMKIPFEFERISK